jgi:undecaprenyl-diphosphatase
MEIIKAIILGVIQGLSEFLPISSTAHLRVIPSYFGWNDIGAAYTAVIQIGTMIAILIYFRKDLINMTISFFKSISQKNFDLPDTKLFINIIIGTIPILIFGYLLKSLIRNQFRSLYVIAGSLIFFSFVIFLSEKFSKMKKNTTEVTTLDAVIIGLFQSIALIPGASRSGITMSGAFIRNFNRESAAKFSFLLSIPAVLISGVYELISERKELFSASEGFTSLITATIVSGIVGYISIWFLLKFVKTHSLLLFIVYRIILGVVIILSLYFNIIKN